METAPIDLKTAVLSAVVILGVETGLQIAVWPETFSPIALVGAARVLESLLIVILVHVSCAKGLAAIGLETCRLVHGLRRGLIWSAGFGVLVALVSAVIYITAGINLFDLIKTGLPATTGGKMLFFLIGGMVSPVAEEIVFRGVLYGYLKRWGVWAAVIFSTLLFVLAHTTGGRFPVAQIVGGVVFALAYERERSLVVPMVIHILGNLAIFSIALF